MAALTTQVITRAGIVPTYGAVAASDTFTPGANTFLHIKNGGASSDTVTVSVLGGDPGANLLIADLSVSITNGTEKMIGPLPANFFADPSTGVGTVAHSYQTSVTVAVLQVSQP